eukprot:5240-Heterococcus_DN1.PRE.2
MHTHTNTHTYTAKCGDVTTSDGNLPFTCFDSDCINPDNNECDRCDNFDGTTAPFIPCSGNKPGFNYVTGYCSKCRRKPYTAIIVEMLCLLLASSAVYTAV